MDARAERGHLQFARHDHLGLVGVDGTALLEEVDGCLVGIYKQDTLAENVEVDELAWPRRVARQRV